jgi:diguanylate cyclase (GGDEF)-like protein/PAS domain S-box-containing protein
MSAIQSEQLKLLSSASKVAVVASTLLATILAFAQRGVVATNTVIIWYCFILFVASFRVAMVTIYQRSSATNIPIKTKAWLLRFRIGVLMAGLVWGSTGLVMFPSNEPQYQMFIIFMLAGLSAGGAVSFSADLSSAILFSVVTIIPLAVRLLITGNNLSIAMGLSGVLYVGFLIVSSRQTNQNILSNITLRQQAIEKKEALKINNKWHHAIRDGAMDGFWLIDKKGKLLEVNKTYCEMSGFSEHELLSMHVSDLETRDSAENIASHFERIMQKGDERYESNHRRKNGSIYHVETSAQYWPIEDGQFVVFLQDISKRRQAADEIEYLAFYDPLTKLPNRRHLFDRIEHALSMAAQTGNSGALLYLDLDNFKRLNDYNGHTVGDLLLQEVAARLISNLRPGDTISRIARIGGDEFVVILEYLSEDDVEAVTIATIVANKILAILNQPFQLVDQEFRTTVSIGIAFFDRNIQSCEDLLKHADIAMYQAKKDGRNKMRFFDQKMLDVIQTRIELERELKFAIEQQQFVLYYQIQVNHLGQALGVEALIRWQHPDRGLLAPFDFIPIAEESELIFSIGDWVLETACQQLAKWTENTLSCLLTLSINVSAKQFRQPNFAVQVAEMLNKYNVNPLRLKLEITESILLDSYEVIIVTMNALKEIGVQFSLDDFGIGYSSLQYLKRLPLQELKIDQSFIRDITTDVNDLTIVSTIITMAKNMGMEVIAEGVETSEQQEILLEKGCTNYQGYLFGEAVPIERLSANMKIGYLNYLV